jgi:hypothetical protein
MKVVNISQNARFQAKAPVDAEFTNPPGAGLARLLFQELRSAGWSTRDLENWRDCGWCFTASADQAILLIALSRWRKDGEWMLQILPKQSPGFINRLFGSKPSAVRADVFRLACLVHEILKSRFNYGRALWRRNGYPREGASSNEPQM